jgi:hypothetical protein
VNTEHSGVLEKPDTEPVSRLIARLDVCSEDADGDKGLVCHYIRLFPTVDQWTAAEWGVQPGSDVYVIDEDYSAWEKYGEIQAQTTAVRIDTPPDNAQTRNYGSPLHWLFHVLRQRASIPNTMGFAEIRWIGGHEAAESLKGIKPTARPKDLQAALRCLKFIAHMPTIVQPGPEREERDAARDRIRGGLGKLATQRFPPKLTRGALGGAIGLSDSGVSELNDRAEWKMNDVKRIYAQMLTTPNKPEISGT